MYPPPLVQWKRERETANAESIQCEETQRCSGTGITKLSSFCISCSFSVCAGRHLLSTAESVPPPFLFFSPNSVSQLLPGLHLFQSMRSTASKLPDLNTGLVHTTWQKRGRSWVDCIMIYCVVKWRRACGK